MSESTPEDEADFALMVRVKAGDAGAFRELVERHQNRVVGTVAKMLGNDRDAEDVAQQVFVRVWKSAGRYEPRAKFTTWLMTITRNLVFNEVRRRDRARMISMDEEAKSSGREMADARMRTASQEALNDELREAVDAAIRALPEAQRMAVVLRRYEGMPYDEIAKVLETTVPAVKSLLFRARADLKVALAEFL
ncbi:MAG: sigma-70 family RNA polymerase sigma factor [Chthoniobacterales bacterium]